MSKLSEKTIGTSNQLLAPLIVILIVIFSTTVSANTAPTDNQGLCRGINAYQPNAIDLNVVKAEDFLRKHNLDEKNIKQIEMNRLDALLNQWVRSEKGKIQQLQKTLYCSVFNITDQLANQLKLPTHASLKYHLLSLEFLHKATNAEKKLFDNDKISAYQGTIEDRLEQLNKKTGDDQYIHRDIFIRNGKLNYYRVKKYQAGLKLADHFEVEDMDTNTNMTENCDPTSYFFIKPSNTEQKIFVCLNQQQYQLDNLEHYKNRLKELGLDNLEHYKNRLKELGLVPRPTVASRSTNGVENNIQTTVFDDTKEKSVKELQKLLANGSKCTGLHSNNNCARACESGLSLNLKNNQTEELRHKKELRQIMLKYLPSSKLLPTKVSKLDDDLLDKLGKVTFADHGSKVPHGNIKYMIRYRDKQNNTMPKWFNLYRINSESTTIYGSFCGFNHDQTDYVIYFTGELSQ